MKHSRVQRLTQFSILLALELLLGLTPIGMIMIPPVSITLMHVPVILCGILMGPLYGGALGGVFGLISMFKATTAAVSPVDMLFSPFLSPAVSEVPYASLASLVMVMVPRILVGVFAALLLKVFLKLTKKRPLAIGLTAVLSTALHTIMVLACFYGFFYGSLPLGSILGTLITLNGGLEILAAALVAVPVCSALFKYLKVGS